MVIEKEAAAKSGNNKNLTYFICLKCENKGARTEEEASLDDVSPFVFCVTQVHVHVLYNSSSRIRARRRKEWQWQRTQ